MTNEESTHPPARPAPCASILATPRPSPPSPRRYLAKEPGPRRLRVNTIAPGPTRTWIGDDAFERYPEILDVLVGRTVLGPIGEPEDIGSVIALLISDDARWIAGQDIQVAGGDRL